MQALEITNIKQFMNVLLLEDSFDNFLLQEATIFTAAAFVVDGHITQDFYTEEEKTELGLAQDIFLPYGMLREQIKNLIKGKKAPVSFKFIFQLSENNKEKTVASIDSSLSPEDVASLSFILKFQNGKLTLVTGTALKTFSMDKSLEQAWDKMMGKFLSQRQIAFDLIQ